MPHDRKYKTKNTNYRPGMPDRTYEGATPLTIDDIERTTSPAGLMRQSRDEMGYNKRRKLEILRKKLKSKLAKGLPSTR
tara:strand:- start:207 stop:443 length:237 start_codon:yes stop_codon:yes gene_type:complete